DPVLPGERALLGLDWARGVVDVGLAPEELVEPAAGAAGADGDADARVRAEELRRDGLGGGIGRAGAVHLDGAGEAVAAGTAGAPSAADEDEDRRGEEREGAEHGGSG